MAEYLVQGQSLTAIANAIRSKTGSTSPMSLEAMARSIDNMEIVNATIIGIVPDTGSSFIYDGSTKSPEWRNYDTNQLTINGQTSATDAGIYTVYFTPKAGYKWWDDTSDPKMAVWSIQKASATLKLSESSGTINGKGKSITFFVDRAGDGEIAVSSNDQNIATVSISGATVTVTSVTYGTTTINISVSAGTNHLESETITYTVTVDYVYLYKNGNQNFNVTGGWLGDQGNDTGTVNVINLTPYWINGGYAKDENGALQGCAAQVSGYGGQGAASVATGSKIDLTNITTIKVVGSVSNPGNYTKVGVTSTNTIWNSSGYWDCAAYVDMVNGTTTLDVSSLSGYYYVVIATHTVGDGNTYFAANEVLMG